MNQNDNDFSPSVIPEDDEDFVPMAEKHIGDKIKHTLSIYPKLSMSMLQVGIGTALTPKLWHPVLEKLKESGEVTETEIQATTPTGRIQVYKVISLKEAA